MTRDDLVRHLSDLGVSPDLLWVPQVHRPEHPDDRVLIVERDENDTWQVIRRDGNISRQVLRHVTENEACEYVLLELTPRQRVG